MIGAASLLLVVRFSQIVNCLPLRGGEWQWICHHVRGVNLRGVKRPSLQCGLLFVCVRRHDPFNLACSYDLICYLFS